MRVRPLVLLALVLVPTASGLTVDLAAPEAAPLDGTPVAVDVTVRGAEGPVELKAWLGGEGWQASRTWNGTSFQRSDHYALTVDPANGTWEGRLWVRANPDSSNHDRLLADGDRRVGVRARGSQRADALAAVDALSAGNRSWAAAGPQRAIAVREEGDRLAVLGAPDGRAPIRVPAATGGRSVCEEAGCRPEPGWRLQRAGDGEIVLAREPAGPPRGGGVVVADGRACALPAEPPEAERWRLAVDALDEAGRCRDASTGPSVAELLVQGRTLASAPERPGRGQVVRDPVSGGWAPWRLPSSVTPEPIATVPVDGRVRAFATAEAGLDVLAQALRLAEDRVTVTTYLLTSRPVTRLLEQAAREGVDVDLWLEPDPVGGQPAATAGLVDRLARAGVDVREAEGPTRGGLQHAKVVVVDSSLVLVLTENLTEHGLPRGGEANRGLGVGVANASLAARVEGIFREPGPSREIRPEGWQPMRAPVSVVTAPENAWRETGVPTLVREADGPVEGAVLRANPRWGPRPNPWLGALVDHSRQAPVDVLLSGAPEGAARSNREALAHLEAHPGAGRLDARLSDPRAGTVHAKALVTPEAALVGSSNWGLGGALLNREVNLIVHDAEIARRVGVIVDGWGSAPAIEGPVSRELGPAGPPHGGVALVAAASLVGLVTRGSRQARWRGR